MDGAAARKINAILIDRREAADEIERLRNEVASLRKKAGDGSSAEPVGCPTPGACSCPA